MGGICVVPTRAQPVAPVLVKVDSHPRGSVKKSSIRTSPCSPSYYNSQSSSSCCYRHSSNPQTVHAVNEEAHQLPPSIRIQISHNEEELLENANYLIDHYLHRTDQQSVPIEYIKLDNEAMVTMMQNLLEFHEGGGVRLDATEISIIITKLQIFLKNSKGYKSIDEFHYILANYDNLISGAYTPLNSSLMVLMETAHMAHHPHVTAKTLPSPYLGAVGSTNHTEHKEQFPDGGEDRD